MSPSPLARKNSSSLIWPRNDLKAWIGHKCYIHMHLLWTNSYPQVLIVNTVQIIVKLAFIQFFSHMGRRPGISTYLDDSTRGSTLADVLYIGFHDYINLYLSNGCIYNKVLLSIKLCIFVIIINITELYCRSYNSYSLWLISAFFQHLISCTHTVQWSSHKMVQGPWDRKILQSTWCTN